MSVDGTGATLIARTDVGGAYRWDSAESSWTQMLSVDTVAAPNRLDYYVASAVVAPSDPDRIYLATGNSLSEPTGRMLRSDDGGDSWGAGQADLVIAGNADFRNGAERLAVDPTDPQEVWFGSRTDGLLVSRDGAVSFSPVDGIPVADASDAPVGVTFVIAEPDGVSIWVGVARIGVFRSQDDGASWEQVYSTDAVPVDADTDTDGRLWVVEDQPAGLRIVDGESIDELPPMADSLRVLGLDPDDPDVAFVGGSGIADGRLWRTVDRGATWESLDFETTCPDVPWLDIYPNDYFPAGSLLIDPADGALWIPEGFGIWREPEPSGALELECEVDGVEEMVTNDVVIPSGGRPVTAQYDRGIFHHGGTTPDLATQGPTSRFNSAWDLDWSPSDPSVVFAVVADHRFCCEQDGRAYASGWSEDGGITWNRFESYDGGHPSDLRFGNIAVSADDVDNLVWLPTFNKAPHVTFDRGRTWAEVTLPGTEGMLNDEGERVGGSHFNFYLNRKVLAADRVEPDTFYLYHQDLGVFRSTDGGVSWSLQPSEGLPTGWTVGYFNATLITSPSTPGHLMFAPGVLVEEATGLYESFDGGATWERRRGVSEVTAAAWGAPAPGSEQLTLYIAGTVGGSTGVWRTAASDQASWELVARAPAGNYQLIKVLGADLDEYGAIVVGFEGTSFLVGSQLTEVDMVESDPTTAPSASGS